MEPVDTILDHLISISNQLIQSSTTALASTINSRDCLSTFAKIENLLDQSIHSKQHELNQKLHSIQSHQLELDRIQDQLHHLWPNHERTDHHHHHHLHYHQLFHPINFSVQQQAHHNPHDYHQVNLEPSSTSPPTLKLRNHPQRVSQSTCASSKECSSPTSQLLSPSVPSVHSDRHSILLDHHARQSLEAPKLPPPLAPPAPLNSSPSSSSLAVLLSPLRIAKKAPSILSLFAPPNRPPPAIRSKASRPPNDKTNTSTSCLQPSLLTRPSPPEPEPNTSLALHPAPPASLHEELKLLKSDHYPP